MRTAIIVMMLMISSQTGAEVFDEDFSISGKKFYVHMVDGATGGCWTNLKDVREYSEEKLRMRGAIVKSSWDNDSFTFFIDVVATRWSELAINVCVGHVGIYIMDMKYLDAQKRRANLSRTGALFLRNENLNNDIFDSVKGALAEFK